MQAEGLTGPLKEVELHKDADRLLESLDIVPSTTLAYQQRSSTCHTVDVMGCQKCNL